MRVGSSAPPSTPHLDRTDGGDARIRRVSRSADLVAPHIDIAFFLHVMAALRNRLLPTARTSSRHSPAALPALESGELRINSSNLTATESVGTTWDPRRAFSVHCNFIFGRKFGQERSDADLSPCYSPERYGNKNPRQSGIQNANDARENRTSMRIRFRMKPMPGSHFLVNRPIAHLIRLGIRFPRHMAK